MPRPGPHREAGSMTSSLSLPQPPQAPPAPQAPTSAWPRRDAHRGPRRGGACDRGHLDRDAGGQTDTGRPPAPSTSTPRCGSPPSPSRTSTTESGCSSSTHSPARPASCRRARRRLSATTARISVPRSSPSGASASGSMSRTRSTPRRPCTGTGCTCRPQWTADPTPRSRPARPGARSGRSTSPPRPSGTTRTCTDETREQVDAGLAGLFLIHDPEEAALALPHDYGVDDIPVIVQDRSFSADGAFAGGPGMQFDGVLGDTILVNGTPRPYLDVTTERVRLRLLNGSSARMYDFAFDDGRAFDLIATDGGLLRGTGRLHPHPALAGRARRDRRHDGSG